jgi:hypothetical protein
MMSVKKSSTTLSFLISRGNFSSKDYIGQLHFVDNGLEKLDLLLQSGPPTTTFALFFVDGTRVSSPTFQIENVARDWNPGIELDLASARLRIRRAWENITVTPMPPIRFVVLSGSTIHLIVECEPDTIKPINALSADSLVFFNAR